MRDSSNKLIEILYLEDIKLLKKSSLEEYFSKANTELLEFLNPELSYPYTVEDQGDNGMIYLTQYKDDPKFAITLKKGGINGNHYWILDFYFPETEKGFSRQKNLQGENYLDTLSKVLIDNIIPHTKESKYKILYFRAYNGDNAGTLRKKVFNKIINKFSLSNIFDIKEENNSFILKLKND